jgi:hypothetical protein
MDICGRLRTYLNFAACPGKLAYPQGFLSFVLSEDMSRTCPGQMKLSWNSITKIQCCMYFEMVNPLAIKSSPLHYKTMVFHPVRSAPRNNFLENLFGEPCFILGLS